MNLKELFRRKDAQLATAETPQNLPKRILSWQAKSVLRTRKDIRSWNRALAIFQSAESPKSFPLQLLYNEIAIDAHLTSQIENRKQQVLSAGFALKNPDGETNEEQTTALQNAAVFRKITDEILNSIYYGYSLIELSLTDGKPGLYVIPRTNVIPQTGMFYPDYSNEIKGVNYRLLPEYGTWVLEFNSGNEGLLNSVVPHVLFKRFAQSCWAELCEIYGIPPRVLKTNTADPKMLQRGEQMMRDMGAAAWFIIDETETMEWATGIQTNGDVYANLMNVCRDEISLVISGAVIGQDTVNGNRSKDESAREVLSSLVESDKTLVEDYWNQTVIPALVNIGVLKGSVTFEFEPEEDLESLFKYTQGLLPFKEIDNEWLKDKFGVEVTGDRTFGNPLGGDLKADNDFFV